MFRSIKHLFHVFFFSYLLFTVSTSSAASRQTLTVYSYSSFMSEWGPGESIKKGFEAECNCQLNVISTGDGVTILNRIKLEGDKTHADVILGLDNNLLEQARSENLVVQHQINPPKNSNTSWWDSEFMPYDYGYFAFIYNQEKMKHPPRSLHELIENKNGWKIVYQDPRTSTPGFGLLLWVKKVYGEQAPLAWNKIAKQTLTVTKSWSEAYKLFLQEEADLVLSYSTSPVAHIQNDNDYRYKAAIFSEGHYRQVEVAAILKYSKQQQLAQQFLRYLLSRDAQKEFAEKNVMYPVVDVPLPNAYAKLDKVTKPLAFDSKEVKVNQKSWIREWQTAVSQ